MTDEQIMTLLKTQAKVMQKQMEVSERLNSRMKLVEESLDNMIIELKEAMTEYLGKK